MSPFLAKLPLFCLRRVTDNAHGCLRTLRVRLTPNLPFVSFHFLRHSYHSGQLGGRTRIGGMKKPLVRVFREVVRITLLETRREEVPMHFLCTVSPNMKLLTFLEATALQRKLSFGALDFSPLRHSPALTRREYYTKKIRPRGRRKFTMFLSGNRLRRLLSVFARLQIRTVISRCYSFRTYVPHG